MANPLVHGLGRLLRGIHAGDGHLAWNDPRLAETDPSQLLLTSPAFAPGGGAMPPSCAGKGVGANVSPALAWTGLPQATVELALVVQDPDAPLPRPVVHCLCLHIPPDIANLAEGALQPGVVPRLAFGRGTFGHAGWSGPQPPPGHGPHRYVFQLFALSKVIDVGEGPSLGRLKDAMAGLVVGRAKLVGTYEVA